MIVHLDTSFAIDLLRERRARVEGRATARLAELDLASLVLGVHAFAEILTGAALASRTEEARQDVEILLRIASIAYPDSRFAPAYAENLRQLERAGRRMATMDLLIATAALLDDAPIVTGDVDDFSRLPALRVIGY